MELRDPIPAGDVSVVVSELLVATVESSDPLPELIAATLVAKKLELAQVNGIVEPPPDWQLEPMVEKYDSKVWAAPVRRR
jgi:hypothetical protein